MGCIAGCLIWLADRSTQDQEYPGLIGRSLNLAPGAYVVLNFTLGLED
jgi:hypothetical protein